MKDNVRFAGFWIRFVAFLIDSVLVSMIVGPLLWKVSGSGYFQAYLELLQGNLVSAASRPMSAGPADWLLSLVLPSIAVVAFWRAREATPGKIWLKLRIVDAKTLGHMSKAQALGRYLSCYV